jgi:hypothetical protein
MTKSFALAAAVAVLMTTGLTGEALAQRRQAAAPAPGGLWERLVQANRETLPVVKIGNDSRIRVPEDTSAPERVAFVAPTEQNRAGELASLGLTVRWRYADAAATPPAAPTAPGQPAAETPPPAPALTVEVLRDGAVVATRLVDGGAAPLAAVQIVQMDSRRINAQVLLFVVAEDGQITAQVAMADATGAGWSFVAVPDCCNGGLAQVLARDIDGDGTDEIVDLRYFGGAIDWQTEAYTLTATPMIIGMVNGALAEVTFEERYQDVLLRRLARWFEESETLLRGRPNPQSEEWRALAIGYVAVKATLGAFEDGWRFLVGDAGFGRDQAFQQLVLNGLIENGLLEQGTQPPPPPAPAPAAGRRR